MFNIEDVKGLDIVTARKVGSSLNVDRYCLDRAAEVGDFGQDKFWERKHVRAVQIAMLEDMGVLEKE